MTNPTFDEYWNDLRNELAELPAAAEVEHLPLRSDEHCDCYGVKLTSWGSYRIFGYLSIPKAGDGPFPTFYYLPRYQSVVEVVPQGLSVDIRRECVTFCIACRGQRQADEPLIGNFPGMLTDGIENAQSYPMRGWVADCLRGLEYLTSRPEVDTSRIAGVGFNDFAIHTAACTDALCCLVATAGLYYRSRDLVPQRPAFPLAEYNDYTRCYPDQTEAMYATLDLFDVMHFADRVTIPTLLWCGLPWGLTPKEDLQPLVDKFGGQVTVQETVGSRSTDGIVQERWLADQLGLAEAVLPEHWR